MFLSLFVLVGAWAWAENEGGSSGSGTSNVAKIGEKEYATVQAAFEACQTNASNPTTVTLLCDVEEGASFGFPDTWKDFGRNIVLDLNNHTYKFKSPGMGSTGTENQAIHLINGNTLTIKNGTLAINSETTEIKRMIQNYCNLTLENVTVDTENVPTGFSSYNNSFCRSTVTLKGNTVFKASKNAIIFDIDGSYCKNQCDVALVIDEGFTGSISGKVEYVNSTTEGHTSTLTDNANYLKAKVGNDYFATLAEAVSYAAEGATVELLRDVEIDTTINIGKSLTIDGKNNNLTSKLTNASILKVTAGDFTIKDLTVYAANKITNGSGGTNADISLSTSGKVEITGCTFDGIDDAYYNIIEYGQKTKVADGTNISGNTFKGASARHNCINMFDYAENATININGNKFEDIKTNTTNPVRISNYSSVAATVNMNDNEYSYITTDADATYAGFVLIQNNIGSAENMTLSFSNLKVNGTAVTTNNTGTANQVVYVYTDSTGKVTYDGVNVEGIQMPVAKIDDTYYHSLEEAISAAETITLKNNVKLTSPVTISKNLTIDLNGKNITGVNTRVFHITAGDVTIDGTGTISVPKAYVTGMEPSSSVIRIGDNSGETRNTSLTIGKNVVVSTDHCYGVTIFGSNTTETLTVNGRIETTDVPAVSGNGSKGYGNTTITINGTVKTTNENAIYHPQSGNLTINGTVIGKGGIEAKAGATTVAIGSKALIEATAETTVHEPNGNGCSTSGYAIAVVENKGYAGSASVDIQGGTIKGKIAIVDDDSDTANNTGKIVIKDGLFSEKPAPEYIAEGLIAYAQEDGKYIIKKSEVSTKVDDSNLTLTDGEGKTMTEEEKATVIGTVKEVVTNNDAVSSFGDTNTQNAISADYIPEGGKSLIELIKSEISTGGSEEPTITPNDITTSVSISLVEAKVTTKEGEESPVVEEMVFNIKPIATVTVDGNKYNTEVPNELITGTIKFRLPVDKRVTKTTVEMFHKGDYDTEKTSLGLFPVLVDENGNKYVEVEVTSFSEYSYKLNEAVLMNVYRVKDGVSGSEYVNETEWNTFLETYPNAVAVVSSENASFASKSGVKNVIVKYDNDGVKTYICPNFVLTDKVDFYSPVKFIAKAGSYSRQPNKSIGVEYTSVEYNSVCLPFALSASQLSQTAKILALAYYDGQKTVYFSEGTKVNAGVPCLIYDTADSWSTITFSNTEIVATPDNHGNVRGTFVATSEYQYSESNPCYTITKTNKFGQAPSSLVSFRSCLFLQHNVTIGQEPTASEQSKLVRSVIGGDDEEGTTDIDDVNAAAEESTGVIYNLNGQKVGTSIKSLPRGIYIKNGKKISVN